MKRIIIKTVAFSLIIAIALSVCGCKKTEEAYDEECAENIFTHFCEISDISRSSGNCNEISDFLYNWARSKGFNAVKDKALNVIAEVPASSGCESYPLTILQTHMDTIYAGSDEPESEAAADVTDYMVFEKDKNGNFVPVEGTEAAFAIPVQPENIEKKKEDSKVKPIYKDGRIYADGQNLGACGGIGISLIMEYLEKDNNHGPLRLIFTADKELDNLGANALDSKYLKNAKYFINLDGMEFGTIYTASCGENTFLASSEELTAHPPTKANPLYIRVNNLVGGKASEDIGKDRLNANKVILRVLSTMIDTGVPFELASFTGGSGSEEIAADAGVSIVVDDNQLKNVWTIVKAQMEQYTLSHNETEPNMECSIKEDAMPSLVLSDEDCIRLIRLAEQTADGVISDESWANLGIIAASRRGMGIKSSLRSFDSEELQALTLSAAAIAEDNGFKFKVTENSHVWNANAEGLLEKTRKLYKDVLGIDAQIKSSKTGLETGSFTCNSACPEMVSLGPDIFDSKTLEEFCNMESVVKTYNLLQNLLLELK